MSANGTDIAGLYISLGLDASSFADDFARIADSAEPGVAKLKERVQSIGNAMDSVRKQIQSVKDQLATALDFRLRGTEALDKLHEQLSKVRDAGGVTDKTLEQLSLKFETASRGARTYVQALDRVASDKSASNATRELAQALANEAREANFATAALEKNLTVLQRRKNQLLEQFVATARRTNTVQQAVTKPGAEQEETEVPARSATSGVVRVASGELSIRAAETFLGGTLGLGSFFQKIFPVVGGFAVLGIFDELKNKLEALYEAERKLQEGPQRIAQEFRELNQPLEQTNDELDLTNAKLESEIAKLTGKPENGLKEALAEARLEADKLAESLDRDFKELNQKLSQNQVGFWKSLVTGQARTDDLVKEFGGGDSGFLGTGFVDRVQKINDDRKLALAKIQPGATKEEQEAAQKLKQQVESNADRQLEDEYRKEIDRLTKNLAADRKLAQQPRPELPLHTALTPLVGQFALGQRGAREFDQGDQVAGALHQLEAVVPVVGPGLASLTDKLLNRALPNPEADRVKTEEGTLRRLQLEEAQIPKRAEKENLTDVVRNLQLGNQESAPFRPFQDKLHELSAQLDGLKQELASVGESSSVGQALAKGAAEAAQEVARLNDQLAKTHQALSPGQVASLQLAYALNAYTKDELDWQQKVAQGKQSIDERVASQRRLTEAIGEGYEAQKRAFVENEVAKFTAPFANDPEAMKRRQGDIEALRKKVTVEFEAQQSQSVKTDLDKLNTQVELETRLASVEAQGAEAVRQATLAFQAEQAAKDHDASASKDLAEAERKLSDLQSQRKNTEFLTQLQRETEATNRLAAAQSGGAEAIRRAQLENRLAEVLPNIPEAQRPQLEQKIRQESAAQEQLQVAQQAENTARSYQNQLDSINRQIAYLQQKKALGEDIQNTEIGLAKLEEERAKVFAQQVAVLGSARDGMRAFFQEMATEGVSTAEQVHDALSKTFESLNDSLAKLVAGQKVSWSSFFEGISEQLTKSTLKNLEANLAGKLFPQPGQSGQQKPGEQPTGFLGRAEHFLSGLFGRPTVQQPAHLPGIQETIGAPAAAASPIAKIGGSRDGQSAASALFVTTVDAGTSANPAPSAAALPPPGAVSNPTSNPLAALGQTLPTPPPYQQQPGKLSLPEAISRVEGFGASPQNIPTRLNNPGDIKYGSFAAKYGATPDQTGFAHFPSVEAGKQAESDLLNTPGYANLPLSQAIPRYNGTNQPTNPAYLRAIEKFTGLSPDTLVRDALKVIPGFAEGGRPDPNKVSIIGENGPELFIPDSLGTVLPNSIFQARSNAYSDAPIPVHPNTHGIHVAGPMPEASKTPAHPSLGERFSRFGSTFDPTQLVPEAIQSSKFVEGFANTWDITSGPPVVKRYFWDIPAEERGKAVDAWLKGHYLESIGHAFASLPVVPGFVGDLVGAQVKLGQRAGQEFHQGDYEKAVVHELAAAVPLLGPNSVAISDLLESGNPDNIAQGLGQLAGFAAAGILPLAGLGKAAELAKPPITQGLSAVREHPVTRNVLGQLGDAKADFLDFLHDPVEEAYRGADTKQPDAASPFSGAPIYLFPGRTKGTRVTGFYDRVTGKIFLNKREPPEKQLSTLIHESAHEAIYPHLRQITQDLPIPKNIETKVRRALEDRSFKWYGNAPPWQVYNEGFAYGTESGQVPGLDPAESQTFIETILREADRKGIPSVRERYVELNKTRSTAALGGLPALPSNFAALFRQPQTASSLAQISPEIFTDLFHLPKGVAETAIQAQKSRPLSGDSIAAFFGALLPQLPFPELGQPPVTAENNKQQQLAFPLAQFGGFRAMGGPVRSDKVHVVGEQGPELFVPETDGTIVPNHKLASFGALMGGSTQKGMAQALQNFAGFREDGGDVQGGKLHIVGEKGLELFLPIANTTLQDLSRSLTDVKHATGQDFRADDNQGIGTDSNAFTDVSGDASALSLADLSQIQGQPTPPSTQNSSAVLNQETAADQLANLRTARQGQRPDAFDKVKSATKLLNTSLPTKPAGNQWGDFLEIASTVVKGLAAGAAGGGADGGDAGAAAADAASVNGGGLGGGGGASGPDLGSALTNDDIANLGDFSNSELGQLDNSSTGTYPDLGMDQLDSIFGGGKKKSALKGQLIGAGITAGVGIISQLLQNRNTIDPHHFKAGQRYYIPDFNAALAGGGDTKAGGRYLVGEKGKELFVPTSLSKLNAYSSQAPMNLPAAVGVRETLPFGGYRASGGTVDANHFFMVGEHGPEMWTPPVSGGSIVPNSAMHGNGPTNLYVDARGTDPSQSSQNFQRALQKTSQHSVKTSFRSVHEFQMRSPHQSGSQAGWS